MLTPSERKLLTSMLQRTIAINCLDLVKMSSLVPVKVEDELTEYRTKIVEMVFDPKRLAEVNRQFQAAGYLKPDDMNVISVISK